MVNLDIYSDIYKENLEVSKYYNPKDKDVFDLLSRLYRNNLRCEFEIHWIQDAPLKVKQRDKHGNIIWLDLGKHKTCTLTIYTDKKVYDLQDISYINIQRIISEVIEPSNDGDLFVGNGSHENKLN